MVLPFNTFKELTIAGLEDELIGGIFTKHLSGFYGISGGLSKFFNLILRTKGTVFLGEALVSISQVVSVPNGRQWF